MLLFQIGSLNIDFDWIELLDITLVGFLLYQVYFLVRGSLASRVFLGYLLIYVIYLLVKFLRLELLTKILEYFMGVGAIALIVIFQQEIRRFLLYVGKSTVFTNNRILNKILGLSAQSNRDETLTFVVEAAKMLAREFTGGLIVIRKNDVLDKYIQTGDAVDALTSRKLLIAIFNDYSPMHDGAVIIEGGRIKAARCILPVSDSREQVNMGFRHRAALGMSEVTDAIVLVISEETGKISLAYEGEIYKNVAIADIETTIKSYLFEVNN
jgi:diadenylate cyclase